MTDSQDPGLNQPPPNVQTRPPRVQRRIGRQLWIAIAIIFVVLLVIIFLIRMAAF